MRIASYTFAYRCEADEVLLVQRITGQTGRLPLHRVDGTDLWSVELEVPSGSRLNYQFEIRRGDARRARQRSAEPAAVAQSGR